MPPSGRPEAGLPFVTASAVLAQGGTLLTATHRLARHLREVHDQAMAASGASAWPSADVLPLDAWLRRTWENLAVQGHPLGQLRLLTEDECQLAWGQVLSREPAGTPVGLLAPLAATSWRLCQLWGITPPELHQSADTDDARSFARWVTGYQHLLATRSWTDGMALLAGLPTALEDPLAMAMTLAPAGSTTPASRAAGLAGFAPLPPAVAAVATALARHDVVVGEVTIERRHRNTQRITADDETDELARAFSWAAGLLRRRPGASVAVVVGNLDVEAATARRIGLDLLAPGWQLHEPATRPVALAAGRQLSGYPVVGTALALLELLVEGGSFEEVSRLLRSPYACGAVAERTGRALAELQLRQQPLEKADVRMLANAVRDKAPLLAGLWAAAASLRDAVRHQRWAPSRWAAEFSAWLAAAGWPGDRGLDSEEHQAAEAWQRLLAAFAATDAVAGRLSLPAAVGQLSRQARTRAFEPEAAPGAIQVLSLREAGGHAFDGLWITGLTADQWPAATQAHALIPLRLQRAAGIPEATADTQAQATRQRLAELVAASTEVVLSWPAQRDGAIQLPSPLLADERITGQVLAEPVAADDVSANPLREAILGQAGVPDASLGTVADPAPALGTNQEPEATQVPGGSRVLAMQAVCPARAFIEFRLGGRELATPTRLLDAANRGRLLHRLLERLYGLDSCRGGLGRLEEGELRGHYDQVLGTVLDEFLPAGDPFAAGLRQLEAERLWPQVKALSDLDAGRPDFTVETEVSRDVRIGALAMKLRLDRLDHLVGGGEFIIDYKTGRFETGGWRKQRLQDSQLPLYAVTEGALGVAVAQFIPRSARLLGVGDAALDIARLPAARDFFKGREPDWPAVLARWRRQLETLAAEFTRGDFRLNPADRTHATGQFASVTRIHELAFDDDDGEAVPEAEA